MISFTVMGRPQQRGSKNPRNIWNKAGDLVMRTDKDGDLILGKNNRPIPVIVVPDDNPNSTAWMKQVAAAARDAMKGRAIIDYAVTLSVACYFARPKAHFGTGRNAGKVKDSASKIHAHSPDASKLLRPIEDALTKVVYVDDRLIVGYHDVERLRRWTDSDWDERAEISVCPAEEGGLL